MVFVGSEAELHRHRRIIFCSRYTGGGADQFVLIPDSDEEGGANGSSLLADEDEYVPETEPQDVVTASRISGPCANQGRQRLGTLLHEWRRLISDVETESAKVDVESAKVQMDIVKLEKESVKVEMESDKLEMCAKVLMGVVKLENKSAKVEMESGKLEMCAKVQMGGVKLGKEELDHMASFSDIETDDEACSFQDGVDLRGHSQMQDDGFNERGLLVVFVIRVGQLLFIKYDVDSICVHAKVIYDIVQDFLGLLHVDHLSQMDGQCCHLVQKQADDFENALSPTNLSYSSLSLQFNLQLEEKNMSCMPNIKNLTNVACDFMRN
ncbi:hypothetical protein C2845_PM10G19320 [Panicum miliaceum]|uniref:Uncharacterized protein n=1 Tax=Panicum miliaceum TaxID=4540 RepID=A0A3L6PFV3_PANMI|nr:hypothetical protein C2845_PM10G19320 [Panicum miliaceum]